MATTLAAVTNMPALALLAEDGKLERSTEPFRRWYQDNEELCLQSPELKRVLDGQSNAAVMKLDDIAVDIAAMADRGGGRHVLLTLPTGELPSIGDAGGALLDGALDESPALVWLKDLDGRYVRANARFTTLLNTSEDRLLGRTDAELPPAETVDGPRVQDRGGDAVEEPLQLEYVVGPFQGRDALVVLRFPVGDGQGVPTLVCGVAAPSSEAHVARTEAARLLRIERWSRLDADSVRAELLADWDLLPDARGRSATSAAGVEGVSGPGTKEQQAAVAEARAERATAVAERDSALSANEKLTGELEAAKQRLAELERALKKARADGATSDAEVKLAEQAAELERGLVRERERAEELERTLTLVRQRLGDDAEAARVEVQRARADAEAARTEVERARTDAESARGELDKARAEADALRAAASAEREAAAKSTAALEREVKQARDQLAALERQQGADDSGAQLRASEKARVAAEAALSEAVSERDAALKTRAALGGELEQERKQVAALRDSSSAAEERIRELTGGLERERVRAASLEQVQARVKELEAEVRTAIGRAAKAEGELELALSRQQKGEDGSGAQLHAVEKARLAAEERIRELTGDLERERVRAASLEQAQARVKELEAEVRTAIGRAAKTEGELELVAGRVQRAERDLETAVARAEKAEGELRSATMRADKAEIELEQWQARVKQVESELERARKRIDDLEGKIDAGQSRIVELQGQLESGRTQIATLQGEAKAGQTRIEALQGEVKAGHAQIDALQGELTAGESRIDALEEELEAARVKTEEAQTTVAALETRLEEAQARTPADPVEPVEPTDALEPAESAPARLAAEASDAPSEPVENPSGPRAGELARVNAADRASASHAGPGVSWHPTAKRTLSASLARESVWRNVLKETVEVLGAEGGWDTVTAWLPDDSNNLGCAATWTAHRGLDRFETATWDAALRREGSLLDQALQAPHLTWLTDIDAVDDERLQSAAAHGMSSALLLPVRSGTTTVGLLELLTHDAIEPDAQIALSLEAAALQLGRFGHLLSVGGKPA